MKRWKRYMPTIGYWTDDEIEQAQALIFAMVNAGDVIYADGKATDAPRYTLTEKGKQAIKDMNNDD